MKIGERTIWNQPIVEAPVPLIWLALFQIGWSYFS